MMSYKVLEGERVGMLYGKILRKKILSKPLEFVNVNFMCSLEKLSYGM